MKKLSKITEGILGDMARRDLHGKNRKQDDINIDDMPFKDFYYYILDHYEVKNNQFDIVFDKRYTDSCYTIEIPVLKFKSRTISGITDKEGCVCLVIGETFMKIGKNVLRYCPDFKERLDGFICNQSYIFIDCIPESKPIGNKSTLELIDKTIEILGNDCILKKK